MGAPSGAASSSMTVPSGEGGGAETGGALPDGGQPKKQRRQLQRRSSDAVVDRAIEEHFQHLSAYERPTMKVGGLTLRQRVASDRQKLTAGQRIGASHWRRLAQEFTQRATGSAQSLSSADDENDNDDQLRSALSFLHHKNPAARRWTCCRLGSGRLPNLRVLRSSSCARSSASPAASRGCP